MFLKCFLNLQSFNDNNNQIRQLWCKEKDVQVFVMYVIFTIKKSF